ncbi:MAG: SDR family oxidoreductase [Actinomycetota bacterium]
MTGPLALVTGAASGIGAEVARRLDRRGYTVIAVDRNDDLASQAAEDISTSALSVGCDLADRDSVSGLCERIAGEWSDHLEVVVCNAGIIVPRDVADLDETTVDRHLDIMLRAPIQTIRSAVPAMSRRRSGHIMATVSMGGIVPMPGSSAYSAAKCGLRAFLASLYSEVRQHDVKVSGIYPSAVDTPMLRHEAASGGSALNFVGEVQTVNDVADAYERALDGGKLEYYVPWSDSLTSRAITWRLSAIPRMLPMLERLGEKGRAKYLATPSA